MELEEVFEGADEVCDLPGRLSRDRGRGRSAANHSLHDDNNDFEIGSPIFGKHPRRLEFTGNDMQKLLSGSSNLLRMRRPVFLFLDWDGTITAKDTTHLIARVGSSHQQQRLIENQDFSFRDPWDDLVQAYSDDFHRHQNAYQPQALQRKSISEEQEWLESLSTIEARSIQRVEESGIFKGVTQSELHCAGSKAVEDGSLHLRDGWDKLLTVDTEHLATDSYEKNAKSRGDSELSTFFISVSWSKSFIEGALQHASKNPHATSASPQCDPWFLQRTVFWKLAIYANEIDGIGRAEGSTGLMHSVWEPNIRTSKDKLLTAQEIQREKEDLYVDPPYVVYVGDSTTDLECLLSADLGICIRDQPMRSGQQSLAQTLTRLGLETKHVTEMENLGEGAEERQQGIYWAHNLGEVSDLVQKMLRSLGD